jgi:hypothetical protein
MLSLMLDLRFKTLRLVSSFIGQEQVISIVKECDQQSLFPIILRCYHILHPMVEFGHMVDMETDEKNSLDIFDMFVGTSEPTKKVVNKELLIFKRFQVDVKDTVFSSGGRNTSLYFQLWHFLLIRFLALLVLK